MTSQWDLDRIYTHRTHWSGFDNSRFFTSQHPRRMGTHGWFSSFLHIQTCPNEICIRKKNNANWYQMWAYQRDVPCWLNLNKICPASFSETLMDNNTEPMILDNPNPSTHRNIVFLAQTSWRGYFTTKSLPTNTLRDNVFHGQQIRFSFTKYLGQLGWLSQCKS